MHGSLPHNDGAHCTFLRCEVNWRRPSCTSEPQGAGMLAFDECFPKI